MSSEAGSWEVRIRKPADKGPRAAPRPDRARLLRALAEMQVDPFAGDVSRLHQEIAAFRRRVGEWRIFFDVDRCR
jgi:mRNA-degrading endonuclease RelE of RelBE toxin-antitoxin system